MSTNRYNLEKPASAPGTATLRYITAAKYDGEWSSYLHTHACAEMFYVVGGKGQFRIEDKLFPVTVNDLVVINPYVMHTETSADATPLEYIVLGVEGMEPDRRRPAGPSLLHDQFPHRRRLVLPAGDAP